MLSYVKTDAEVAYIDYSKGDKNGYIRLTEENSAKTLIDKLDDNKLKLGDEEVSVRAIEGDEETEYLAKQVEQMISRRGNNYNKGKQGGRGRFNSRKRSAPNDRNDSSNKRSK